MQRVFSWVLVWFLMIVWCVAIRPFVPSLLFLEPAIPLLVASLMLGPLRIVLPLMLVSGLVFDAFQPFPQTVALYTFIGISVLIGLSIRFILASRSFYTALVLIILTRLGIAGLLYLLGPGAALWPGDRAMLQSPLFFLLLTVTDVVFLLIGFRLVSRPLLGVKRVQIAR